ncbi:glycosyltransferase [Planktomarina sp.]|nr:glycosyltransferase [Planktomarina sp.]
MFRDESLRVFIKEENIEIIGKEILDGCTLEIVNVSSNKILWILWLQIILPLKLYKLNYNVLFSPGNISPILKTTEIKSQWIATIGPFDTAVYSGLSLKQKIILLINKYLILFSVKTSNVVIHESKYSLSLLKNKYSLDTDCQFLIECGKSNFFNYDININHVANNYIKDISDDDLLCVSHFYPYKNMERMIKAFFMFLDNAEDKTTRLFICGLPIFKSYYQTILELVTNSNYEKNIIFVGGVNHFDLRYAYSKCRFLLFPSLCESSGYALIEAMSCGTPILATRLTAIPFTCGDAALYFDAYDIRDQSLKLQQLYNDQNTLNDLSDKSFKRSDAMMNYEEAADAYFQILVTKLNNL